MAEENTTNQPTQNQNPALAFLIFIIVIGLLALAFFFGLKYRQTPGGATPTPTPEVTNVPSPQPTPTPEEAAPTPTVDESGLIKQAVFKKTEASINKNTGQHATGNIKEFEAVGGAYWLAAKTDDGWGLVFMMAKVYPPVFRLPLTIFPKTWCRNV